MLNNKCIVVLGMHRSGTSALTAVLSMLGAYPSESLIPPEEDVNPKGFWEHADIVSIHDELLQSMGFTWYDERPLPEKWWSYTWVEPYCIRLKEIVLRDFSQTPLWILKDPRCCRLLPLWLKIFEELHCTPFFVIILRNPSEVVSSLTERAGFHEAKSYLLWLRYVLDSEKWSKDHPRAIVTYEQLLDDWRSSADSIANQLGLEWPLDKYDVQETVEEFLDSSLRHHLGDRSSNERWVSTAHYLYEELIGLVEERTGTQEEMLKAVERDVDELQKLLAPVLWSVMQLKNENKYLHSEISSLHSEMARIKSTLSWQITKPLRALGKLVNFFKN